MSSNAEDKFNDLVTDFKKLLSRNKKIIFDQISQEGVSVHDIISALHIEQMRESHIMHDSAMVGSFPYGGMQAVPAGRTIIDVEDGGVVVESQPETKFMMNNGLRELGEKKFRSAFIFYDQPANIIIDGKQSFPLQMGVTELHIDIRKTLEIDSFMPAVCSVVLSTGDKPPISPVTSSFDFWRFSNATDIGNGFSTTRLRPKSINFKNNPADLGAATREILDTDLITHDDQGTPVISQLTKMTIMVENEDDTNSANVRFQVNCGEGETRAPHPVTGDNGIPVKAGDFAIFNISNESYYRIQVDMKRTVSGSAVEDVKTSLKGIW